MWVCGVVFVYCLLLFRQLPDRKSIARRGKSFVMRVSDDEMGDESESDNEEVSHQSLVAGRRFNCDELYLRFVFYFSFFSLSIFFFFLLDLMILLLVINVLA